MGLLVNRLVVFRVKDDLGQTLAVTQIDKDHTAMIPAALDPSHEHDLCTHIFGR